MADFIRARSDEKKQLRMKEIMDATDRLFQEQSYHGITLTTIAEALGWSRGNLYKYVTTKEEIFLEIILENQADFFKDIRATFKDKGPLSDQDFSGLWTDVLNRHRGYIRYYSILATIIETNVTVERLVEFKKNIMSDVDSVMAIFTKYSRLSPNDADSLYWAIMFHASGLNNVCSLNPLVQEAMEIAGIPPYKTDFSTDLSGFINLCLRGYKADVD
ncbi:TetR family transcriptional regulator [Trichococcus shcherbakoviae]|uniref:TetR family transcriptional regulator n=1 Tax=Trichococcus shcherbakoviae TaxID=2094020 RepID=UPI002AA910FA|nr:TetR family transcriptional regulator [Trichococcus shcherbakoviae]